MRGWCALTVLTGLLAGPCGAEPVTAILEPARLANIHATVAGRLAEIPVSEGEEVAAGAVLARIDSRVQSARVDLARVAAEAEGGVARSQRLLERAEAVEARVSAARSRGAAQPWEGEEAAQAVALAKADRQIAREQQARAAAQLALEEAMLREYDIAAPFDATVLDILREPGETVEIDTPIMEIGRLDLLEATAFVPVGEMPAVGAALTAEVDGMRRQATEVRVLRIDPRLDPASRTVRVTFELDNAARDHPAGATLIVEIE